MNTEFNVILYDVNTNQLEQYDVIRYLVQKYEECSEVNGNDWYKVPKTDEEFKTFVERWSKYQFWSRCEYEIVVTGFPIDKEKHKIDAYYQIMMNIDFVVEALKNKLNILKNE